MLKNKLIGLLTITLVSFLTIGIDDQSYEEPIAGSEEIIPMAFVPGGKFLMGSPEGEPGRQVVEGPQHEVSVGDFWMSSKEITWDQYQLFLYRELDRIPDPNRGDIDMRVDAISGASMPYVNFNLPGYPVVDITQYAASMFCKWLTAKTGRFYRLPTEAEWEYACRAGSTEAFSFGDDPVDLDRYAWHWGNSGGMLRKGGLKEPNAFGLYDMHGNVAEWVVDKYGIAQYQKSGTDPVSFAENLYPRVVRGGSYKDKSDRIRAAARDYSKPEWKQRDPQFPKSLWWHTNAVHVGFRIVRPKSVPSKEEMEKYWGQPIPEY